jgi:hypothetical protein
MLYPPPGGFCICAQLTAPDQAGQLLRLLVDYLLTVNDSMRVSR